MTIQEFKEKIGNRPATVMVCQVDGSPFYGSVFKSGDMVNVDLKTAFGLYKQFGNVGKTEVRRWEPKDVTMTAAEEMAMNDHFEKEHARDSGEAPVKISKHKK